MGDFWVFDYESSHSLRAGSWKSNNIIPKLGLENSCEVHQARIFGVPCWLSTFWNYMKIEVKIVKNLLKNDSLEGVQSVGGRQRFRLDCGGGCWFRRKTSSGPHCLRKKGEVVFMFIWFYSIFVAIHSRPIICSSWISAGKVSIFHFIFWTVVIFLVWFCDVFHELVENLVSNRCWRRRRSCSHAMGSRTSEEWMTWPNWLIWMSLVFSIIFREDMVLMKFM